MMRTLAAVAISTILASLASGEVYVTVYRCDGQTPLAPGDPNTPHVYSDIMVGTRLVLVVSSDVGMLWWGGLQLTWADWDMGKLVGRGFDPNSVPPSYADSCLEAAGRRPSVSFVDSLDGVVFEFTSHASATPGDWFVIDYHAEKAGSTSIEFFDYAVSFDVPGEILSFTHVPSRDFDGNGVVNLTDFASLASHWRQPADPNVTPAHLWDLDADQLVGPSDLAMLTEYWLERTNCLSPATEPNAPADGL